MNSKNNSEKGQAIVYLVLGIVVFLGFVALAIDGGMALSDRRHAQNGADAASLAGGAAAALYFEENQAFSCDYAWSCENNVVYSAKNQAEVSAIDRARENSFTIQKGIIDQNGVETTCGPNMGDPTEFIDVTVAIASTTPSNFMQLIYPNALRNEVQATTRVDPGGPVAFGDAIIALNTENCSDPGSQGVIMGGSGKITVTGGNVFSNGCLRQNGGPKITVNEGVPAGHQLFNINNDDWTPDPVVTSDVIIPEEYSIDMPRCDLAPANHRIDGASIPNNYTFESGLWCISGNVTFNNTAQIRGTGITIVMLDGKFWINGKADIQITAPALNSNPSPAVEGLLIYLPPTNANAVILNGNQTSLISGLIYAPSSKVQLNGTGGNTYNMSQIIGYDVELTGDADLILTYDSCNGYINPPFIDLRK